MPVCTFPAGSPCSNIYLVNNHYHYLVTENYYLSPQEQHVLDIAREANTILTEDIIQAAGDMHPQTVRNVLSSLVRKGHLFRAKRGIYLRCGEPSLPVIEDPRKLALLLFKGYVAFASALQHWELLEYESFTVFVATRNKSGRREIGEYLFRAVAMGGRARGMVYDGGIYVSSLEKTIFDCIYKPVHAGGYPLVARAVSDSRPDWKEVLRWFDMLGSQSLRQRGGYLLSKAGNAPRWLLDRLRYGSEFNVWLDPSASRRGRFNREWRVMDNVGGWNGG